MEAMTLTQWEGSGKASRSVIRQARSVITEAEHYIAATLSQTLEYDDDDASDEAWSPLSSCAEAYAFDEVRVAGNKWAKGIEIHSGMLFDMELAADAEWAIQQARIAALVKGQDCVVINAWLDGVWSGPSGLRNLTVMAAVLQSAARGTLLPAVSKSVQQRLEQSWRLMRAQGVSHVFQSSSSSAALAVPGIESPLSSFPAAATTTPLRAMTGLGAQESTTDQISQHLTDFSRIQKQSWKNVWVVTRKAPNTTSVAEASPAGSPPVLRRRRSSLSEMKASIVAVGHVAHRTNEIHEQAKSALTASAEHRKERESKRNEAQGVKLLEEDERRYKEEQERFRLMWEEDDEAVRLQEAKEKKLIDRARQFAVAHCVLKMQRWWRDRRQALHNIAARAAVRGVSRANVNRRAQKSREEEERQAQSQAALENEDKTVQSIFREIRHRHGKKARKRQMLLKVQTAREAYTAERSADSRPIPGIEFSLPGGSRLDFERTASDLQIEISQAVEARLEAHEAARRSQAEAEAEAEAQRRLDEAYSYRRTTNEHVAEEAAAMTRRAQIRAASQANVSRRAARGQAAREEEEVARLEALAEAAAAEEQESRLARIRAEDMYTEAAALKIQCVERARRSRQAVSAKRSARDASSSSTAAKALEEAGELALEAHVVRLQAEEREQEAAAIKIQATSRARSARRQYEIQKAEQGADQAADDADSRAATEAAAAAAAAAEAAVSFERGFEADRSSPGHKDLKAALSARRDLKAAMSAVLAVSTLKSSQKEQAPTPVSPSRSRLKQVLQESANLEESEFGAVEDPTRGVGVQDLDLYSKLREDLTVHLEETALKQRHSQRKDELNQQGEAQIELLAKLRKDLDSHKEHAAAIQKQTADSIAASMERWQAQQDSERLRERESLLSERAAMASERETSQASLEEREKRIQESERRLEEQQRLLIEKQQQGRQDMEALLESRTKHQQAMAQEASRIQRDAADNAARIYEEARAEADQIAALAMEEAARIQQGTSELLDDEEGEGGEYGEEDECYEEEFDHVIGHVTDATSSGRGGGCEEEFEVGREEPGSEARIEEHDLDPLERAQPTPSLGSHLLLTLPTASEDPPWGTSSLMTAVRGESAAAGIGLREALNLPVEEAARDGLSSVSGCIAPHGAYAMSRGRARLASARETAALTPGSVDRPLRPRSPEEVVTDELIDDMRREAAKVKGELEELVTRPSSPRESFDELPEPVSPLVGRYALSPLVQKHKGRRGSLTDDLARSGSQRRGLLSKVSPVGFAELDQAWIDEMEGTMYDFNEVVDDDNAPKSGWEWLHRGRSATEKKKNAAAVAKKNKGKGTRQDGKAKRPSATASTEPARALFQPRVGKAPARRAKTPK